MIPWVDIGLGTGTTIVERHNKSVELLDAVSNSLVLA
jgi:hypothetical protein